MRVVIAGDSVLLREGVARLLADEGFDVVAKVESAAEPLRCVEAEAPDVAVVDIRMPPTHTDEGLVAAETIRRRWPLVGVLVLSQYVETEYALRLLEGSEERCGYLLKDRVLDVAQLTDAVRRVGEGGVVVDPELVARLVDRSRPRSPLDELTQREREVLALIGGRPDGPGHRRALVRDTENRGDAHPPHFREARTARNHLGQQARARCAHVPAYVNRLRLGK